MAALTRKPLPKPSGEEDKVTDPGQQDEHEEPTRRERTRVHMPRSMNWWRSCEASPSSMCQQSGPVSLDYGLQMQSDIVLLEQVPVEWATEAEYQWIYVLLDLGHSLLNVRDEYGHPPA